MPKFIFLHDLQSEIRGVIGLISKIDWLKENGYDIRLPDGIGFDSSKADIENAVRNEFTTAEQFFKELVSSLESKIFKNNDSLDIFFSRFAYDVPSSFYIYLTYYGTGGSYNTPNRMSILMTRSSSFIFETIIHEAIHLIIENPFIKKHKVSHWEKEGIVDWLCGQNELSKIMPNYKKQKNTLPNQRLLRSLGFRTWNWSWS